MKNRLRPYCGGSTKMRPMQSVLSNWGCGTPRMEHSLAYATTILYQEGFAFRHQHDGSRELLA